jgi:hypothetical protein
LLSLRAWEAQALSMSGAPPAMEQESERASANRLASDAIGAPRHRRARPRLVFAAVSPGLGLRCEEGRGSF